MTTRLNPPPTSLRCPLCGGEAVPDLDDGPACERCTRFMLGDVVPLSGVRYVITSRKKNPTIGQPVVPAGWRLLRIHRYVWDDPHRIEALAYDPRNVLHFAIWNLQTGEWGEWERN